MKKVTIAAIAAMVLVTGASADILADTAASLDKGYVELGAGYASTDGTGSAALSIAGTFSNVQLSAETSTNYFGGTAKAFVIPDIYVGGGYLRAKGHTPTECTVNSLSGVTTCVPAGGTGLGDPEAVAVSDSFTEKGAFAIVGTAGVFGMGGSEIVGDIGYRFGTISGPVGSLGVFTKIGEQKMGVKIGIEQIKSDVKDIDRVGVFGVISF